MESASNSSFRDHNRPMQDYFIKLLLIGDQGVGKSCLMSSYSEGEFPKKVKGTAGIDYKVKNIKLQDKLLRVQIWDTAG